MKVYGLREINNNPLKLFREYTQDKDSPEKWSWKPHNPGKIKNISSILDKEREEVHYSCITNYTPLNEKQDIVLIFSMGNLSYGFIKGFEKYNLPYVFIDFAQFVLKGNVTSSFSNNKRI